MSQTEVSDAVTSQIDQVVIWHSFELLYALFQPEWQRKILIQIHAVINKVFFVKKLECFGIVALILLRKE